MLTRPLIAEFPAAAVGGAADDGRRRTDVVQMIRLGAARQHVDAVLIYEVGVRSSSRSTWLSLADLTIVGGAFLPTRSLTVDGRAEALLLDVRNAYPYGTASAVADLSMLHTSWGSNLRQEQMQNEAVLQVVGAGSSLAVDANGRFDLQTATRYGEAIAPYPLFWYEEPGDPLDYMLNAALAERYPGALATGENLFSLVDTRNLIRYGGMRPGRDWLQFECALSYGLVEYLRTLAML